MNSARTLQPIPLAVLGVVLCLAAGQALAAGNRIEVTSLTDDGSGGCTLREAIRSANTNTAVGGCAAGSGAETDDIWIMKAGAITLNSGLTVTGRTRIVGPDSERPGRLVIKVANGDRALTFNSPSDDVSSYIEYLTFGGSLTGTGGGILVAQGDSLTMNNCVVRNCSAAAGGGLRGTKAQIWVYDSVFAGNRATSANGGAIFNNSGSLTIAGSIFSGNAAAGRGGAAAVINGLTIQGSTFAGNRAGVAGGALFLSDAYATVNDSIFWGNAAPVAAQIRRVGVGDLTVNYSDVQGAAVWPGTGNLNANPAFILAKSPALAPTTAGNYHLRHTSPCVNTGDPSLRGDLIYGHDLEGDQRGLDGLVDIGADEAGPPFNASFEYGAAIPAPWIGSGLSSADRRVCPPGYSGRCSFRLTGSPAAKRLEQVLPISGGAGRYVHLSASSRTQDSVAGHPYLVVAILRNTDATETPITLVFPPGTHPWSRLDASINTTKAFNDIVISLEFTGQSGTAWFDDIQVNVW